MSVCRDAAGILLVERVYTPSRAIPVAPARRRFAQGIGDRLPSNAMSAGTPGKLSIEAINRMAPADFSTAVGKVYEHSPWIAERAFALRPFATRLDILAALYRVVQGASRDERLALLRAHPELAGREAQAGTLTAESTGEQASAGLDRLPPERFARLGELNRAYREKFGFPAIVAVRLNSRDAIFHAFEGRLRNTPEQELQNAIGQVCEIARLRLADLLPDD
jgi:2-oxo-4-hydroxy-4-carboxy-5-ureidoimidazoline decarboxylase